MHRAHIFCGWEQREAVGDPKDEQGRSVQHSMAVGQLGVTDIVPVQGNIIHGFGSMVFLPGLHGVLVGLLCGHASRRQKVN